MSTPKVDSEQHGELNCWRITSDSAELLLARLGVVNAAAADFLRGDARARRLLTGRGGKMVQAQVSSEGALQSLVARYPAERSESARTHFTRLTVERVGGAWTAHLESAPLGSQLRLASGTIRSTLFAARSTRTRTPHIVVQPMHIV